MKFLILALSLLVLPGCAMLMGDVQTVEVPVPVPCDPPHVLETAKPIDQVDPERANQFEIERALWATVEDLEGYAAQLKASADACRSK